MTTPPNAPDAHPAAPAEGEKMQLCSLCALPFPYASPWPSPPGFDDPEIGLAYRPYPVLGAANAAARAFAIQFTRLESLLEFTLPSSRELSMAKSHLQEASLLAFHALGRYGLSGAALQAGADAERVRLDQHLNRVQNHVDRERERPARPEPTRVPSGGNERGGK